MAYSRHYARANHILAQLFENNGLTGKGRGLNYPPRKLTPFQRQLEGKLLPQLDKRLPWGTAAPRDRTITVKFDYDFRLSPVCLPTLTKLCV
jgi:hypothetical protein